MSTSGMMVLLGFVAAGSAPLRDAILEPRAHRRLKTAWGLAEDCTPTFRPARTADLLESVAHRQNRRATVIFRFGDFELDTGLFELRHAGRVRKLEPQVFNLLELLLRKHDQVVSKDDILAELWRGRVVSDATLSTCIKAARHAIGDDGDAQRLIRTVRGRGFRFVGALEPAPMPAAAPAASSPRQTTLALLPFDVFSNDADLDYLADGLVEDLTTAMARIPALLVISRASSFAYKGKQPTAQDVREELGVDYMVEGSVRRVADQLRIHVQLIDTATGGHLWARHFDRPHTGINAVQDEIALAIGQVLEPALVRVSYHQARVHANDRNAWQRYQQASGLLAVKGWHPDTFAEAVSLLRQSISIDPAYSPAHAYLALILALGHRIGLLHDRDAARTEGLRAADAALALDDTDSTVLGFAGCALADLGQAPRAMPVLEKAIEQDPSNAQAWAAQGAAKIVSGAYQAGIADLRHGIKISPLDNRLAVWGSFLAVGLMLDGQLDEAIDTARTACRRDPRNHIPHLTLAATLLAAGKPENARTEVAEAYRLHPQLSPTEIKCLIGSRAAAAVAGMGFGGGASS
ncbi:MAG: hypothetical protein FHP94_00305 [Denitromonas halophila]|nr:MAG: hypothetical protein FHP94_00305 [Denitromonas halophila]